MEENREELELGYGEFKQTLDSELQKTAEGFVRIGYLLKVARDTNVLAESGYQTVTEFAQAEYGLTKDIVSRYIGINDRYSERGYSQRLQEKYKEYGVAKLAEMLTLPEAVIESMSPELTRKEIQDIKKELKEEEQITDLEVMLEERPRVQPAMNTMLQQALYQYCRENREAYVKLHDAVSNTAYLGSFEPGIEKILDAMAPSGIAMLTVRIAGTGKLMLSIRGKEQDVDVLNIRSNEKASYTWKDVIQGLEKLCDTEETPERAWEKLYGEPFQLPKPQKEPEPVPVKLEPQKEPEKRAAETEKVLETKKPQEQEKEAEKVAEPKEEPLPGQMEVRDYPEVIPEEPKSVTKEPENVENTLWEPGLKKETTEAGRESKPEKSKRNTMLGQARNSFSNLKLEMDAKAYKAALESARNLVHYLEEALEDDE